MIHSRYFAEVRSVQIMAPIKMWAIDNQSESKKLTAQEPMKHGGPAGGGLTLGCGGGPLVHQKGYHKRGFQWYYDLFVFRRSGIKIMPCITHQNFPALCLMYREHNSTSKATAREAPSGVGRGRLQLVGEEAVLLAEGDPDVLRELRVRLVDPCAAQNNALLGGSAGGSRLTSPKGVDTVRRLPSPALPVVRRGEPGS